MKLEDIHKLCEAATPGPWYATETTFYNSWRGARESAGWDIGANNTSLTFGDGENGCGAIPEQADAEFIAAARALVPKLLAVAEAAQLGAFHHNACPWLVGQECLCAKKLVIEALAALEAE